MKCIDDSRVRVVEGELRCKELSDYLIKMNTVRSVWLSEDATAIVSKVKYDPVTNQIVGVVLPLNKSNGCPISFSFMATSADTIRQYIKEPMSKFVYIVMAQPLDEKIPPFLLQMFGTNSSFTTRDVIQRWQFTKSELER